MFGSSATTSIQGIEKVLDSARKSRTDLAFDVAKGAIEKARGINDEKAIEAIRRLLSGQTKTKRQISWQL